MVWRGSTVSTRNRERRRAKQKAAREQQRRQARAGAHGGAWAGGQAGARGGGGQSEAFAEQLPAPQLAELLIATAVQAQLEQDAAGRQCYQSLLVEGVGGPGGHRVVDRVLMSCLQRDITCAWRRGWQPADLVRVTRRNHAAAQVRMTVDVIAAEMRAYAAATVDEQWELQLRALEAEVWWERDDHYLQAWGEREGLDRAAVIGCALDVLCLVDTLPDIPKLYPLPGAARRGSLDPAACTGRSVDQRTLDRVRALLAKAESTGYPEEAEAFTAKAQELMARHSIDYALLAARTGLREEPVGRRVGIDNPYEAPKVLLLDAVARANRCRSVWSRQFGFATVLGFPTDLDAVELLYTSLLVQATAAMVHAGSRRDRYGRSSTRSFRQSFLTAYAHRIGERLSAATRDASRDATEQEGREELLPVLVARDDAVRAAVEAMFPELNSHSVAINNREGWISGLAAADRASLNARQPLPRGA
jgi:hypothetical protein